MDLSKSIFGTTSSAMPDRTGEINKIFIKEKLAQIGVNIDNISLGDFDTIGKFTAEKNRSRGSELYNKVGAYFRPNYERGILIYSLIKEFKLESFLEIGFGRGYSTFCAALAFSELGKGKIITVDPALEEKNLKDLTGIFPSEWFSLIEFNKATSDAFFKENTETFDFIYIDGDHRYDQVKRDWDNSKDLYSKFLLFDDYHLPGKMQKDMEVSNLVDTIDDESKELIIMDRRIFFDDRQVPDKEIDYGQVLLTK